MEAYITSAMVLADRELRRAIDALVRRVDGEEYEVYVNAVAGAALVLYDREGRGDVDSMGEMLCTSIYDAIIDVRGEGTRGSSFHRAIVSVVVEMSTMTCEYQQ